MIGLGSADRWMLEKSNNGSYNKQCLINSLDPNNNKKKTLKYD